MESSTSLSVPIVEEGVPGDIPLEVPNYYEFLQISPNVESETIHRDRIARQFSASEPRIQLWAQTDHCAFAIGSTNGTAGECAGPARECGVQAGGITEGRQA
jgi:hypothetical protein